MKLVYVVGLEGPIENILKTELGQWSLLEQGSQLCDWGCPDPEFE